jgi:antitoxin CptB
MIEEFGRLRWACRRGIRELDVLLTRYADEQFERASPDEQAAFRALLAQQNGVIYAYCLGQASAPDEATRVLIESAAVRMAECAQSLG